MKDPLTLRISRDLLTVASLSLAIAGCTTSGPSKQHQTQAEACSALGNVVTQSASDFKALKQGAGVTDYDHTRWDTPAIFEGADCDVLGWGAGKSNYACTWSQPDAQTARKDYESGVAIARTCLGATWAEASIPGSSGEGLRFSRKGSPVVVDVRLNQERSPSASWMTSLTVGSPINRNAK